MWLQYSRCRNQPSPCASQYGRPAMSSNRKSRLGQRYRDYRRARKQAQARVDEAVQRHKEAKVELHNSRDDDSEAAEARFYETHQRLKEALVEGLPPWLYKPLKAVLKLRQAMNADEWRREKYLKELLPSLHTAGEAKDALEKQFRIHKELTTQALAMIPLLIALTVGAFYVFTHSTVLKDKMHDGKLTKHAADVHNLFQASFLLLFAASVCIALSLLSLKACTQHQWCAENQERKLIRLALENEEKLRAKRAFLQGSMFALMAAVLFVGIAAQLIG